MAKLRGIGIGIVVLLAVGAAVLLRPSGPPSPADPANPQLVAQGQTLYQRHCASCHGSDLQGQADWQVRKPNGALPAPPHDESGHTWHHPDQMLFQMTKFGTAPFAPEGWVSEMPAFEGVLTDQEIWAVLAYIKSRWPERAREFQRQRTEAAR